MSPFHRITNIQPTHKLVAFHRHRCSYLGWELATDCVLSFITSSCCSWLSKDNYSNIYRPSLSQWSKKMLSWRQGLWLLWVYEITFSQHVRLECYLVFLTFIRRRYSIIPGGGNKSCHSLRWQGHRRGGKYSFCRNKNSPCSLESAHQVCNRGRRCHVRGWHLSKSIRSHVGGRRLVKTIFRILLTQFYYGNWNEAIEMFLFICRPSSPPGDNMVWGYNGNDFLQ